MTGSPLEFLTLRIIHTEPPAICQIWFKFSCLVQVLLEVSTPEFLLWSAVTPCICLSVSPISEICPGFFPLLWIQEELLVFQSVWFFTCCQDGLATFKRLTGGTGKKNLLPICLKYILPQPLNRNYCLIFKPSAMTQSLYL